MIANILARSARTLRVSPTTKLQTTRAIRQHSSESRIELYGRSLTERKFQNPMHVSDAQSQYVGGKRSLC
jgi:hypothetical protein